jgi:hypothetical protein
LIVLPATLGDLRDLAAQDAAWQPHMDKVEAQWAGGPSWSAYIGERLIAVFGLFQRPSSTLEAWFLGTPEASRHMLALTKRMRTLLRTELSRLMLTLAAIRPGNPAGEKLGRLLGFEPMGEFSKAPGLPQFQFWRYLP